MSTESPTSEGFPATPEQMPEPEEIAPHMAYYHHEPNPPLRYGGDTDEWWPGDPLYANRRGNYVRRIFQILNDLPVTTYNGMFWCGKCDVLWEDKPSGVRPEESPCWACGTPCPTEDNEIEYERRTAHRQRACS